MKISEKMVEYKTNHYRIQVETKFIEYKEVPFNDVEKNTEITVFDIDNNLVVTYSSFEEAKNLSEEVLKVINESLK